MITIWEQESLLKYDIFVVGSGIVGLQTAIQARIKFPERSVAILERGLLPTGASTRNAGFAATGSLSELVSDSKKMTHSEIFELFALRKQGLDFLRRQFGDTAIGYENNGSFELLKSSESSVLNHLDTYNYLLKGLNNNQDIFVPVQDKLTEFGWADSMFQYCLQNTTEAALHTGKLMRNLMDLAIQNGVMIITGAEFLHYEDFGDGLTLFVNDNFRKEPIRFKTEQLIFCTNAFSKVFFPDEDVQPGRGQVLLTSAIKGLKFKGIFHFDEGYYYFRNIGDKVLFGGGRNLDFEREQTTDFSLNEDILNQLKRLLKEQILPNQDFEIEMEWSGIMAFGNSKKPIVSRLSDKVIGGFRLGGMGVALGSMLALELVKQIE
ncbi:MAG TPA: FAD-dependent oxidoreductase [Edaphocola sp.]|nr:FAD-dependent oxidoreductase [Edaphocola sp.]